jgi:hypothetical protein
MLNSHKIEVSKAIGSAKLSISDFSIIEGKNSWSVFVVDSGITFAFTHDPSNYHSYMCSYTKFAPSNAFENPDHNYYGIHDLIRMYFTPWLVDHAKVFIEDRKIIDPWKSLNESHLFDSATENEFNSSEINTIVSGLDRFETFTKEKLLLDQKAFEHLQKEIQELKEEVKKGNKRKFVKYFYGFLITQVWDIVRDESRRQMIVTFFKDAFATLSAIAPQLNQFN